MRCLRCHRVKRRCLCLFEPKVKREAPLAITLIQTIQERDHPKNSGTLLRLGLDRLESSLLNLASHHSPSDEQNELFRNAIDQIISPLSVKSDPSKKPVLLYPITESSINRSALPTSEIGPHHRLIVLDMTWGHSERLLRSAPQVSSLARYSLHREEIESMRELTTRLGTEKFNFSDLRSGKRRVDQISTFEATLFSLVMIERAWSKQSPSALFRKYEPLWESYESWLHAQLNQRSTR